MNDPSNEHAHELDLLRAQVQRLSEEVAQLRQMLSSSSPTPLSPQSLDAPVDDEQSAPASALTPAPTSRRNLLKWGGLGAAAALTAAGTAGATGLDRTVAHAADGGDLVLGANNTAEHTTKLTFDGTTNVYAFMVDTTSSPALVPITGRAPSGGLGVLGYATGDTGVGIQGVTDSGYAVYGNSGTGIDLFAAGTGRLYQVESGFTGAPTSGSYNQGEQIRDGNGDLYICVSTGSPGAWRKVAAVPSTYIGGGAALLSTPIRVYDTRPLHSPFSGATARNIQVTGVTIGGVQVPAGATGAVGNLTVTNTTSGGYLVIYPQGSSTPTTSTVNYLSGQTNANSFIVGLGSTGEVTIHSFQNGHCDVVLDITGFIS